MKTLIQLAQQLKVTPSALRHRIRNGTLKATKIGRDWFVDEREVKKILKKEDL